MHLPLIKTSEEALALTQRTGDPFYLAAHTLQLWLSDLSIQAIAQYAEQPDPAARQLQTGQAWRAFPPVLGSVPDEKYPHVISCLTRFSECDNSLSTILRCALGPIYLEHEFSGDFLGPKAPDLSRQPHELAQLMRRSVERMCDWLDAVIHLNAHVLWFRAPACFDPDPAKRRRAARLISEPYLAQMAEPGLVTPFLAPALGSQSGSAPAATPPRPWPHRELDKTLIALWPMVKLHNWTCADLWNVLREGGVQTNDTPCSNPRRLAIYCCHTLGLRKTGCGQTARAAQPPGHALALRLLTPPPRSPRPGQAPWS